MDDFIYLDYAATTPLDPEVLQAMMPYLQNNFGNASSTHSLGKLSREAIETSRKFIADKLGASPSEIIFTGGGTESDNMAILGTAYKLKKKGKHVITTSIEHAAVKNSFKRLRSDGFRVTIVPVNRDGLVDVNTIEEAICDDTILISVMFANNEVGTIQPIGEIGRIAEKRGIIFHTDAVQAFGKLPINLKDLKVDLLSTSAHKIYGPKGVGLLYMRNKGTNEKWGRFIQPILFGGGQEFSYRPSTENIPGIVGFAKAVEISYKKMEEENLHQKTLRDDIIHWTLENIPKSRLNGHSTKRLSNNINLCFPGVDGEKILEEFDNNGIEISLGSACHAKSKDISFVLAAMGLSEKEARGAIRITLGRYTTKSQLEFVKMKLWEIIQKHNSEK